MHEAGSLRKLFTSSLLCLRHAQQMRAPGELRGRVCKAELELSSDLLVIGNIPLSGANECSRTAISPWIPGLFIIIKIYS